MTFTKFAVPALAAALALSPMAALANHQTSFDAATKDAVTKVLVKAGYEVRGLTIEGGMYEAYVIKNGKRAEVLLDDNLKIVSVK